MKSKLLCGALILIALGIGYLIGSNTSQPAPNAQINSKISSESGTVSDKRIIPIKDARKFHQNLKDYLANAKLAEMKEFLSYPITIHDAKKDFLEMLSQDSLVGIRMYPGLRNNGSKPEITYVFVATRGDSDLVYKKNSPLPDGTKAVEESAKVQDNNRPCNPCNKATFSVYPRIP